MNKLYLFTIATAAVLLTGCSKDPDMNTFYTNTRTNVLVTQKSNQDNNFVVAANQYNFTFDYNSNAKVALTEDVFGSLGKFGFAGEGTYQLGNFYDNYGNLGGFLYKINVISAEKDGHNISNLTAYLTDGFWEDPVNPIRFSNSTSTIITYTIDDDYLVRSFPTRAVYPGQTKVYKDGAQVKVYNQLQYCVTLNLDKMTADVMLYNSELNLSANPQYSVLWLRSLDIEIDHRGYYIVGAGVVPQIQDGNSWIDLDEYTFSNFRMQMTDEQLVKTTVEAKTVNGYTLSLPSSSYLMLTL